MPLCTPKLLGILTALWLVLASAALADDTSKAPAGADAPARKAAGAPKGIDADEDGVVSQQERAKARQRFLERFDKDGDGKLSDEERQAARAGGAARRKQRLGQIDTDGDGKISDEERAAAQARHGELRQKLLQKYDTDGDGKLSDSERAAARAGRAKQPPQRGGATAEP